MMNKVTLAIFHPHDDLVQYLRDGNQLIEPQW
jgi:hypothetical protein